MTTNSIQHRPAQGTTGLAQWNQAQLDVLRQTVCPGITDAQLKHFGEICAGLGLSPFRRQISAVLYNNKSGGKDLSIQIGIDGYRALAQRTGRLAGMTTPEFKETASGPWIDVWPYPPSDKRRPIACRVGVLVQGAALPTYSVIHWAEFGQAIGLWTKYPIHLFAKTCEAHALRRMCQEPIAAARERLADAGASVRLGPASVAEAFEPPETLTLLSPSEDEDDEDLWPKEPEGEPPLESPVEVPAESAAERFERAWDDWQSTSTAALAAGIGHRAMRRQAATVASLDEATKALRAQIAANRGP